MTGKDTRGMSENVLEFRDIYDAYQARIFRYLARMLGEQDAEDLTQEVFVKVSQALSGFRGESQLSTWIYRIATNAALDKMHSSAFRQDVRENLLDDLDELGDTEGWMGQEPLSVDQQLMQREMYECFGNFVRDLPVKYRAVVVLSELEELGNKEIAEILGLTLDVVKIRLHRGRDMLFRELRVHCKAEDWL